MIELERFAASTSDVADPKLAIIIACWNYADYVGEAISSILDQKRTDCELIVVDDGSTDGSWDVIRQYPVTAYRIKNSGQRAACAFAVERTKAPFILFLDADDKLIAGALDTILPQLDETVSKLQFPLIRVDRNGMVIGDPVPKLENFHDSGALIKSVLANGTYTTPPTSGNVFRRDLCHLLKDATYDRAVDGVILFAAPFFGTVVSLSTPLGHYRVHDRNDSGLGRPLDPELLRREIDRFTVRMEHLRQILANVGRANELVATDKAHFWLERSIYLAVAEGRRVSLSMLWRLLRIIAATSHTLKTKAALTAFLLLTAILPNRRARRGLAYRLNVGHRSMGGLLRAFL
ncbi:glycosyltransferase family 2 protein [Oryzifoliimicrobium ureilyticus]|uniref:glycosyltransferase family 2 protein n=1 Tax=Oryzifoliimicrobium ureilyticus TaxID=3113724 RepID=UPI0030763910